MSLPHVPPTYTNLSEWVRKAALVINRLIGRSEAVDSLLTPPVDLKAYKVGVKSASSPTTIEDDDTLFLIDASAGPVSIDLPLAADNIGRAVVFKKVDASLNAVTLAADGADLIDGAATLAITTQYLAYHVVADSNGWWVI